MYYCTTVLRSTVLLYYCTTVYYFTVVQCSVVQGYHPIAGLVMGGRRADVVDVTAKYYIPVYINTYPYNFLE
jgi:hypothetical protein